MDVGERALVRKLVESFHLNVPERTKLPYQKVSGSLVVEAIAQLVDENGRYPVSWRPEMEFDGGLIEQRSDGTILVHWKAEVGVMRFATVERQQFTDLSQACEAYARRFFGAAIDGVPIDWQA